MKIEDLIKQPEGRRLEFKENLSSKIDLCKTIVAFANDAGGEIYIGVKDNPRKVTGIDEDKLLQLEEKIINIIHDGCSPAILPEIFFKNYQGRHIIVVKIFQGNNPPYHLKNKGIEKGTYIRVGSSNRLANQEIIEELQRKKQNISFDALPVYEKEFNQLEWYDFKRQYEEITGEELSIPTLTKLNLIVKEQNREFPVNAFVLLSSDRLRTQLFPYAKIECARFKGTVPGDFIDQKTIDLPVSFQPEEAYQFVLRHISKGAKYEGVYRKDRWEYPIIAIREVIRNAVIHRDYALKGKDIKIAIFDDKIEITSPGKLLPTIDFDEMEAGQSDIRNKTLAPVFKKLGIIEQWGNGLRLIYDELKNYPDIDFVWSEPGLAFRASFIKKNYKAEQESRPITTDYDQKPSDIAGSLQPTADDYGRLRTITDDYEQLEIEEKKLLLYLLDNEKISRKEAVNILNIGKSKTFDILNGLLKQNFLIRKGKGRSTYYTLKKREENE